jgi:voltage-gated potassium channel Kch
MAKATLRQKLKYKFDNSMSKGPSALIGWLALVTLLMILIGTAIIVGFSIFPIVTATDGTSTEPAPMSFFETLWQTLMRSMDAGTVAGDTGWPYRILMLTITLGGIFIVSTLVGVLSNVINEKLEELRKGRSFVVESGHQLILGWNSKVFTIINELVIANENQKRPRIVVLATEEKTVMEDEIKDKCPQLKNTKVICRSGNPNDMVDLAIVNPQEAKSIILLAPVAEDVDPDAQTIKNILAITNNPKRKEGTYHIVAEMRDEKNIQIAKIVGKDEVELLLTDDLVSRIMVQTCRQSGLSVVYAGLTEFEGAEIYFNDEEGLYGKTYGEAIFMYKDSAVMGFQTPDGKAVINPPMDSIIENGSKIIAITEDDDTLILDNNLNYNIDESVFTEGEETENNTEKTLILGWNNRGSAIIREMDNYVKPGSAVKIIAGYDDCEEQIKSMISTTKNMKVEFIRGDVTDRPLLDSLNVETFDHIIVLSYVGKMDLQSADSQTLITLLHLRDIADIKDEDLSIVSEIMDVGNRELASVTKADDFVVSDKMISQLMSQVSENKDLMRVFEYLFDSEGSEIYLKPVTDYVRAGVEVNFYTLLASAKRKGQTVLGYRIVQDQFDASKSYGVVVNPVKSNKIVFHKEDKLIVLAED